MNASAATHDGGAVVQNGLDKTIQHVLTPDLYKHMTQAVHIDLSDVIGLNLPSIPFWFCPASVLIHEILLDKEA